MPRQLKRGLDQLELGPSFLLCIAAGRGDWPVTHVQGCCSCSSYCSCLHIQEMSHLFPGAPATLFTHPPAYAVVQPVRAARAHVVVKAQILCLWVALHQKGGWIAIWLIRCCMRKFKSRFQFCHRTTTEKSMQPSVQWRFPFLCHSSILCVETVYAQWIKDTFPVWLNTET